MLEKIIRENLFAIATAYRKATGESLTQVSKKFYGKGNFFAELRSGKRSISVKSLSDMLEKFRAEWPSEADWPVTRTIYMGRRRKE